MAVSTELPVYSDQTAPDAGELVRFAAALRRAVTGSDGGRPRSIILFGSRARGDHRQDSDWDVAAVWERRAVPGYAPLPRYLGAPVQWTNVAAAKLQGDLAKGGSLARGVCAWGRVVWGEPLSVAWQEQCNVDIEVWATKWSQCMARAARAVSALRRAERHLRATDFDPELQASSLDFAETVAKLVLIAKGLQPVKLHNVEGVAAQVVDDDALRSRLLALNGSTQEAHVIGYEDEVLPPSREPLASSRARLAAALALLDDQLSGRLAHRLTIEHRPLNRAVRRALVELIEAAALGWRDEVVAALGESELGRAGAADSAARAGAAAARINRDALAELHRQGAAPAANYRAGRGAKREP